MNNNSLSGRFSILAVLLIGCGLAVYTFATPALSQNSIRNQQQQIGTITYAQLTIQGDDKVTWDEGGSNVPRVASLDVTYRRLGGMQRTSVVNLLNVIGSSRWELVVANDNVWTFKRRN